MNNYTYTYACRNIFNTIKTSGHSSLEKYTSHFIERVRKGYEGYYCVRGKLETEQNCNILAPTLMAITAFLSRSSGLLNRGPGGGQPLLGHGSHSRNFSLNYLNFLSPGLYIKKLTPNYFPRGSKPLDSQGHPLISSTGCTCYLHRCISSFDSLAGSEVNMQQTVLKWGWATLIGLLKSL